MDKQTKIRERTISQEEAERAIYIDFECFMGQPPTIIGFECDEKFKQVICDRELELAARAKCLDCTSAQEAISHLLDRAVLERRRVVAYSQHEKNIARLIGVDLGVAYADARLIAKRWLAVLKYRTPQWHESHPHWAIKRDLKSYFPLIGYKRGKHLGEQKTTSRMRAVKEMLERKRNYELLTPVVKAKWTKVLDHNKHDVLGMKKLIQFSVTARLPR